MISLTTPISHPWVLNGEPEVQGSDDQPMDEVRPQEDLPPSDSNMEEVIEGLENISGPREKDLFLLNDIAKLLQVNETDKAIELALQIANYPSKSKALLDIFIQVLENYELDKALELADRGKEDNFFLSVYLAFRTPSRIRESLSSIVEHITNKGPSDNGEKDLIWLEMSRGLMGIGMVDESIAFANRIEDPSRCSMALQDICNQLVKWEDTDFFKPVHKALEVADMIPLDKEAKGAVSFFAFLGMPTIQGVRRRHAVLGLFRELIKRGDIDKAMEIVGTIDSKKRDFKEVFTQLMRIGGIPHLIEVLNKTSNEAEKTWAFSESFNEILEGKQFDHLIEFCRCIPDGWIKDQTVSELARFFLKEKDIQRALDVIEMMPSGDKKTDALCHAIQALIES